MMKKMKSLLILMFIVVGLSGCKNIVEATTTGTFDSIEEYLKVGEIVLDIKELNGETVYTFGAKKGISYSFDYEIDVEEGDFQLEILSGEQKLDSTHWTSDTEAGLKVTEGNSAALQNVGGTLTIENAQEKVSIIVKGKEATGKLKIKW
ncbi:hypothetical protein BC6307_11755 [Sutcliffiella cohnii]|uniref:Lipocalin-like domain-containing protein n=1 Tax=Sutcliffiella cohnii TaxID=33932 RepID=A0A223KRC3_9BACI|nr:hypothetical protein [Sutcliffiella cohnii]AST91904.1 hypothetical protein BC6307_11755 [Sutcliffiella cohnii]